MINRREFLRTGTAAFTALASLRDRTIAQSKARASRGSIPLVHITDLYQPPQDPDDHIDLATIVALEEYDLRGVILDTTERFLVAAPAGFDIRRDPGFVPVVQMGYLLGRAIPVAVGPIRPLGSPEDDVAHREPREQAGVELLLELLERSASKLVVSTVGSCRVLAAAYNRNPGLLHSKIHSVLLNAGSTGGAKREWNVGLDPEAYIGLWRAGLPIHWYPCATERSAFTRDHERGTYWKTTHAELFRDLAPPLQAWFSYAFSGESRGDIIHLLSEEPSPTGWDTVLLQERNLWATASLVMGAGRVLAETSEGWRFVPSTLTSDAQVWPWRLDRINATVNEHAEVQWQLTGDEGNALLFGRERGATFGDAMAEALGALLGSLLK
jgi:hypothetical protein